MEDSRVPQLVKKYLEGSASADEETELMKWYRNSNEKDVEWPDQEGLGKEALRLKILGAIQDRAFKGPGKIHYWRKVAAAALILLSLSLGGYFFFHGHTDTSELKITSSQVIKPGTSGATLVLANGQAITLGQSGTGTVLTQGQTTLRRQNDSLLVYQKSDGPVTGEQKVRYNTLQTSRGHQFQVILPDGTKVWLNATSSLKYPTAFTGKTRTVELSGEAYFEVAHDNRQPFRVVTLRQVVEDIGTHFDINAYPEDQVVRTTLLEGAVRVTLVGNHESKLLHPGEQAVVGGQISIKRVDTMEAVAWKNGQFIFRSTSVKLIMEQISRWYDVNIVYEDQDSVADRSVWGSVSRYANVSEVLNMIELTGIAHFQVKGRKIIVTK